MNVDAKSDWPFDQPRNCATITMRQVLEGTGPILLVSHDADAHSWQFIGIRRNNSILELQVRPETTVRGRERIFSNGIASACGNWFRPC